MEVDRLVRAAALAAAGLAPEQPLRRFVRWSLGRARVALCLHRVAFVRRADDWLPAMTIAPDVLDDLVGFLLSTRPGRPTSWLTVSFDDGYADAISYVAARAPRRPEVEWLVFVCPEKIERGVGYRWDLVSARRAAGAAVPQPREIVYAPADVDHENEREDLRALAARPEFRLASVEALRELARLPNVSLGNHTNCHFPASRIDRGQAERDFARSTADFERLFGTVRHFAFPFGGPHAHFDDGHVLALRSLGDFQIWSSESRPHAAAERVPGAVLPRYSVDGTRSWRQTAFVIGLHAMRWRAGRVGYRSPAQGPSARGGIRWSRSTAGFS